MSGVKRAMRQFTFGFGKTAGRNSAGRITSFHRGGGAKRLQRTVDLKRNTASSLGVVERIEYDPNRSANIALVRWLHGVHHRRAANSTANASASAKILHLDPAAAGVRGVFALNSMLPRAGIASRDVFLSAFSSKAKAREIESEAESVSSLGVPRVAVAAAWASFFAPRVRGEEALEVRNWRRNSDAWTHRNKRKAAVSWQSIAR